MFGERDQIIENPEAGMQHVLQQAPVAAPAPRNREPAKKPNKNLCLHKCTDKRACGHNCCKRGIDGGEQPAQPRNVAALRNHVQLGEQGVHGYAYESTSHNGQTVSTSFTF